MIPKKTKYRKAHKGRIHGLAYAGSQLSFGSFGLKAIEPERVTERQIEACRSSIQRFTKRTGKLWIRIFPDLPISKKPLEVRQGKGKGNVELWAVRVKPGKVLFEIEGVTEEVARGAFELAASKLPIKTKFVKRVI